MIARQTIKIVYVFTDLYAFLPYFVLQTEKDCTAVQGVLVKGRLNAGIGEQSPCP